MFPVIPAAAEPLVQAVAVAFTEPTLRRFCVLMCGLIVTMGRRTVSHTLVAVQPVLDGHWSGYHRLYSAARFSMWDLAAALVRQAIKLLPADARVELPVSNWRPTTRSTARQAITSGPRVRIATRRVPVARGPL